MIYKVDILRGIPGAGKSTLTKKLINEYKANSPAPGGITARDGIEYKVVSADHYFERDGVYKFDVKKINDAHKDCMQRFTHAINNGISYIIVDNTNLAAWEISPYYALAEARNYDVQILSINCPPDLAHDRGVHEVSWDKTKKMQERKLKGEAEFPWHWKVSHVEAGK